MVLYFLPDAEAGLPVDASRQQRVCERFTHHCSGNAGSYTLVCTQTLFGTNQILM